MKIVTHTRWSIDEKSSRDAMSLVGIVAGMGLLLPPLLIPEAALLALPALVVLIPSLLYGAR